MALTKEETLQQEYSILEEEDDKLQKKIFNLKTKQQDLKCEIESLTENIKLLEKQKAEKSWKITCFNIITFGIFKYHKNKKFDKKIKEMKIKSKELTAEISKNTKIKWSLKNQRLKVAERLIKILKDLLSYGKEQVINVQTEIHQEISQKLDAILEHSRFNKTIDNTNSSSSLTSDSSGYNSDDEQQSSNINSKDSGLDDILIQSLAVTCEKSNDDDDDGIEVIPEPEENEIDDQQLSSRQNSEDSAIGSELEQSVFDKQLVNSYNLVQLSNSINRSYQQNKI